MSGAVSHLYLVAHQGNERGDDNCEAPADDGRQLIAKRLARSRRHHGKDVIAGKNGSENFVLTRARTGKAEHLFQRLFRLVHLRVHAIPISSCCHLTRLKLRPTATLPSVELEFIPAVAE